MYNGIEHSLLDLHTLEMGRDFRREALFDHLSRYIEHSGRALDVGCGTGFMVEKLCKHGLEVTGLEISKPLLDFAKKQLAERGYTPTLVNNGIFEVADFTPTDIILCLDVIEHIEDDKRALKCLREGCRNGARLILTVPAHPSIYSIRDKSIGHFRRYTRKALREKLVAAGFTIESCYHWNAIGVPYYWLFGKVLNRELADNLRSGKDNSIKKLSRRLVTAWLKFEGLFRWLPCGLTLIAIAHVNEDKVT